VPKKDPDEVNPTVLRMLLGAQLRALREEKGVTRKEAAYLIRGSESKMSRLELGRHKFKVRDITDLLVLYGVTDPNQRDAIEALARQANQQAWWYKYSDVLPSWFQAFVGLEEAATRIRSYENQLVPGLLQTEAYSRAVITVSHPDATTEEIECKVSLRLARQQLLVREDAPRIWAVLDEAVLRRPLGGREVMRAQLERLKEATDQPNLTLQVLRFRAGAHAAMGQQFFILRFGGPELPDVVYLEQPRGALYLDKRDDVDYYAGVMDRLTVQAETPEKTAGIINETLKEI